ncbi:MAG TPA: DMT family transporter, partial [Chitinophagaceae bacterium]|nr:DMT family transporter [Chitinophagaceae bacterium]
FFFKLQYTAVIAHLCPLMQSRNRLMNWIIFIVLSFIWGSSFILMKEGLRALSAYQVASLRMVSAGVILLPVAVRHMRKMPSGKMGYAILSGVLGSFIPAFLFCIAETRIDSSLAGILNALTPICVIIIGILFFKNKVTVMQTAGVLTGFIGLCLLFVSKGNINFSYLSYALLVVLATLSYGLNVNMVNRHLLAVGSFHIATFAFVSLMIPALVVLWFTGFFDLPLGDAGILRATGASALLGVASTAAATVLFYVLLKRAGTIFASMVTYGIPFVAIFWGVLAGETITLLQILCLAVILAGVYVARR